MSIDTMSPSTSGRRRGNAVHHLLVDRRAHRGRIPVIALERRLGARPRGPASPASTSSSCVVTPTATAARSSARTRPTSWFTRRSLAISACERSTIIVRYSPVALSGHRRRAHLAHRRRVVDHRVQVVRHHDPDAAHRSPPGTSAAFSIVVEHRPRRPLVHLQPFQHHLGVVVRALHQHAAAAPHAAPIVSPARRWTPHAPQTRRLPQAAAPAPASGTTTSTTTSGPLPRSPIKASSASACATVRGNPSSTKPAPRVGPAQPIAHDRRPSWRRPPVPRAPSSP